MKPQILVQKNSLYLLIFLCCIISVSHTQAQVSLKATGSPDLYKAMKGRILAVEILEEDLKEIDKRYKTTKTEGDLARYKRFVPEYNVYMKQAVDKNWTFNKNIEYVSRWQIGKYRESKDPRYVFLSYYDIPPASKENISGLLIPALRISFFDKDDPEYLISLPSTGTRPGLKYMDADFKMALLCMQRNFEWIIANNKMANFEEYARAMTKANCARLAKLELNIDKGFLHKSLTPPDAEENYGRKVDFIKTVDFDTAFMRGTEGEAVLFSFPYDILGGITFIKVVAESKTGDILYFRKPSMESGNYFLKKSDFREMGKCVIN